MSTTTTTGGLIFHVWTEDTSTLEDRLYGDQRTRSRIAIRDMFEAQENAARRRIQYRAAAKRGVFS